MRTDISDKPTDPEVLTHVNGELVPKKSGDAERIFPIRLSDFFVQDTSSESLIIRFGWFGTTFDLFSIIFDQI